MIQDLLQCSSGVEGSAYPNTVTATRQGHGVLKVLANREDDPVLNGEGVSVSNLET
jgi:hypothetical protein